MSNPAADLPRPLGLQAAAWLLHLADPQRLAPQPGAPLPWPAAAAMLETAAAHGVLPAVLRGMARQPGAPAEIAPLMETWRGKAAVGTAFGMMLSHHAGRVMQAARDAGLHGFVVKGATIARRAYGDASLRSFTDVDFLLPPGERAAGRELLASLGFQEEEMAYRTGHDYNEEKWLLLARPEVMVELHVNLVHNPRLRQGIALDHASVLAAGDGNPEDAAALLLVAAVHGASSHQFDRLQHVVDMLLLARGAAGPVDVTRLHKVATACRALPALAGGLAIAGRVFAEPRCQELSARFGGPLRRGIGAALLAPGVILRAQTPARGRDSWRRKLFREMLRLQPGGA